MKKKFDILNVLKIFLPQKTNGVDSKELIADLIELNISIKMAELKTTRILNDSRRKFPDGPP
jgi:hypothetical protein